MSVEYTFYTGTYKGDSIPQNEWDRLELRAETQLNKYKRDFTVTGDTNAESMAICEMADVLYYFEGVSSGAIATSSSIGSVSTSGASIDASPAHIAHELYKAAKTYLIIYRGAKC